VNVDLVAAVAVVVGRMVVEDYIVDLDLGVDIVLHGLMYLVRIIVEVLVPDLDLEIRRLLIVSVFIDDDERWGTYHQDHIPPSAYYYYPYSTRSFVHQS
jgi:hypothetical protein